LADRPPANQPLKVLKSVDDERETQGTQDFCCRAPAQLLFYFAAGAAICESLISLDLTKVQNKSSQSEAKFLTFCISTANHILWNSV
jgi:hypothetical protein